MALNSLVERAVLRLLMKRLVLVLCWAFALSVSAADRPNVLFIAVDDLRPEIASFGSVQMVTPNIDKLAERSVRFDRAYCMVPTCGASRASLMSGIRPAPGRFMTYLARADEDAPGRVTLNTHFKKNGYHTVSMGKIFHHTADNVHGWSEKPWKPRGTTKTYAKEANNTAAKNNPGRRKYGPAYESADVADEDYRDGVLAAEAVNTIGRLSKQEEPFFLAVGFTKPHLPFVAPKRYWDLYDFDKIQLPENYKVPENAPKEAIHSFGELRSYHGVPKKGPLSDIEARRLIHGYYACVSYTDAHIGRLMKALEENGLDDNTVIVLWGDHGWNLGDHTLWCKHCCFESSMRAPLMFSAPTLKGFQKGAATKSLAEFIDIYPTLCDLTGLDAPSHLHGKSLVPILKDPSASVKPFAIGRYRNGDTIRDDRYRLTVYQTGQGKPPVKMLYDHTKDPLENVNIADDPALKGTVHRLSRLLGEHKGRPFAKKK